MGVRTDLSIAGKTRKKPGTLTNRFGGILMGLTLGRLQGIQFPVSFFTRHLQVRGHIANACAPFGCRIGK